MGNRGPGSSPRSFRLPGASSILTGHERELLQAVARTALPGGEVFPRAGAWTAAKLDGFLATVPAAVRTMFRTVLWAIEAHALVKYQASFAKLYPSQQQKLLESWHSGDAARRLSLRALLTPLKIAHFNDPSVYAEIGCSFREEPKEAKAQLRGVLAARDLGRATLECDVVVVGTGAGGAACAAE